MWGDDEHETRVALQQVPDGLRPREAAGCRAVARVHDDRGAAALQHRPHVVQERVGQRVVTDLHVRLEDPRTRLDRGRRVVRGTGLG